MEFTGSQYWTIAFAGMLAACGGSGSEDVGYGPATADADVPPATEDATAPDAATPDPADPDATPPDTASDAVAPDATPDPTGQGGASPDTPVPSDCEPSDPSLSDANAQGLFDYPHVPTFDFHLPAADWEWLQDNAQDEVYVEAQACFEGRLVGKVGLRFKGYYGTLYGCFEDGELVCPRLSLKVKFDKYVEDQRFYGLKRLNFNAYRYDDSRMKEKIAYDLYRSMGIVAPRAAWAVVRVNGESLGLYGMVEQVDGRFSADRWPDNPDGNVYKEVWPGLASASDAIAALETNEEAADASAFVAFSDAVSSASDEDMLETLSQYLDLDYMAHYLAVDDAVASYDGITYFWTDGSARNNHNYYFYEEAPNRFVLIPWDVEATFWINPDHAAPHWTVVPEDCSLTYEYWDGLASAPACDPIIRALGTDLDRWRAASRELLDGPFALETMLETIDRHAAFIGTEARADPTPTMYGPFDDAVENLRSVIPDLRERLESLIAE